MAKAAEVRLRILDTALDLLRRGGREAVSTRAVTSALNIQAPTIYRIFGDKQGLLDAVALYGFESHLGTWGGLPPGVDPIEALRHGWDMHVQWGIDNPHLYSIAYGDGRSGGPSPASQAIDAILRSLIEQVALDGRLAVPVEEAVQMLRAVGTGVVFTLLAMPEQHRDLRLSERGREAALASFLTAPAAAPAPRSAGPAMQLRTQLDDVAGLSDNERALLGDWLDRIAGSHRTGVGTAVIGPAG